MPLLFITTFIVITYIITKQMEKGGIRGIFVIANNQAQLKVVIIGAGYVGLTTSVCLAYLGHKITCVDRNHKIIDSLNAGEATIYEPGLQKLLRDVKRNLAFSTCLIDAFDDVDVVIIAVGTPSKINGDADLSAVEKVAEEIGDILNKDCQPVIVNKSTVLIGSARRVETIVKTRLERRGLKYNFFVASNPEFLREGAAIIDTLYPDRIVVGANDTHSINVLRQLYAPILEQTFTPPPGISRPMAYEVPAFITTNPTSAELIKYAANAFLAMKVSFINEFAGLSEKVGADIKDVARGIGFDKRIGTRYLEAGLGWGGSCFGKDTKAIMYMASQYSYSMDLLQAAIKVNYCQRFVVMEKLQMILKVIRGCTVGLLGLAFKPNTDDLRDAPSINIIEKLIELGARVKAYDPVALIRFQRQFPELDVECCNGVLELSRDCDALVLITDWLEFSSVDWEKVGGLMRQKIFIDGRNMFNKDDFEKNGFTYQGVGR
ncbi:nucleotide sugar dehydrogenase [Desulfofarcimen acetoxidans DSM 771]|jgi:UDPglucose 6-dehydrogenase|uniref:UDP-glucose 6-dehydrogenase n=1 Tax=Desulfofarcimen acetoxidans (strain ATCC 49208 / DSM 771 / KCTC 5769 / VKM B-1644 / 5575) TaxID=485916 RepID=C8W2C7_DESAS|nr:UDP-glucose/GDP-mannose dehydrogenase family protein [Desulfofarcimen acetoxidans]ACV63611.1 nucleotide sugar dehydrogenase [Desulfofarcimen acetoxidans DSM 771]